MKVIIGDVDITPHINPRTYKMNAEKTYESWQDGNFVEHRVYTRQRIKGSFEVVLYGKDGMTTENFFNIWNDGVTNNVATMLVYVQNTNSNEAIYAYYDFKGTFHKEMINGEYCNKLTIEIVER